MAVSLLVNHELSKSILICDILTFTVWKTNYDKECIQTAVSRSVALIYGAIVVFLAVMRVSFIFAALFIPMGSAGITLYS